MLDMRDSKRSVLDVQLVPNGNDQEMIVFKTPGYDAGHDSGIDGKLGCSVAHMWVVNFFGWDGNTRTL